MIRTVFLFLILALLSQLINAQREPNYDESKVPEFKVPDPLKTFNGKKIRNVKQWENKRRPELLDFFTQNIYGKVLGVNLVEKIRDEEKFNSVEELISQMKKDEETGKEILSKLIN